MKLFAIRKQRGELLILSAENEAQAVKCAGMDMDTVHSAVAQLQEQGLTIDAKTIIRGGIGPQAYEICELTDISMEFKLDEMGDLELRDIDPKAHEIVYEMYPMINAADDTVEAIWPGPILSDNERLEVRQFMSSVVFSLWVSILMGTESLPNNRQTFGAATLFCQKRRPDEIPSGDGISSPSQTKNRSRALSQHSLISF